MSAARQLATLLADPAAAPAVAEADWTDILCVARAERLLGSLAHRLAGLALPDRVRAILDAARSDADAGRVQALWEAEMARRALAPLDIPTVLLKGTAFVAAGLDAGQGRLIGDLDILVPRGRLDAAEAALLAAGWEWVKPDPYDDAYYRRWMHELPPLIHRDRDRMIDVHHTILPLTARPKPDAAALIAASRALENGLRVLCPEDMVIHSAAHLLADGDLAGGLRNLWDIDRLVREFGEQDGDFCLSAYERAWDHGLLSSVTRAFRLASRLFGTPVKAYRSPIKVGLDPSATDSLYVARLLARDGWGRPTRPLLRFAFYLRSHWIRMPPLMLVRHLWIKWRRPAA